ncbi:hypothetical protein HYW55_02095 [Candidatus Gottesmanbacteria bacterium]|nr:hypothetical protein [Candidatus Gottesmanbacteria bacterium]
MTDSYQRGLVLIILALLILIFLAFLGWGFASGVFQLQPEYYPLKTDPSFFQW